MTAYVTSAEPIVRANPTSMETQTISKYIPQAIAPATGVVCLTQEGVISFWITSPPRPQVHSHQSIDVALKRQEDFGKRFAKAIGVLDKNDEIDSVEEDFGGVHQVHFPRKVLFSKIVDTNISELPKRKPFINFFETGDDE